MRREHPQQLYANIVLLSGTYMFQEVSGHLTKELTASAHQR